MELREINRRIVGLRHRRNGLRIAIQELGVGIIEHANEHGDCTAAARMLREVEPRLRTQINKWFGLYSPIKVHIGKAVNEDKARFRKPEQDGYNAFNIDGARANNWWEVETPKKTKSYNIVTFREDLQSLLKRYEKRIEDGACADAASVKEDMATLHAAIQACGQREATPVRKGNPDYDVLPPDNQDGGERLVAPPVEIAA